MKPIDEMLNACRVRIVQSTPDGFAAEIQMPTWRGTLIASWDAGWEHVSVAPSKRNVVPTWDDMCYIKNLFWTDDECVVQFHPPASQYVNNLPNCLHLWKPRDHDFEMPPSILTGIRPGQSRESVRKEIGGLNL